MTLHIDISNIYGKVHERVSPPKKKKKIRVGKKIICRCDIENMVFPYNNRPWFMAQHGCSSLEGIDGVSSLSM
jgi:hypothetical protein